uniref:NADH dehydrogenase subunit 6 n=1 Tax=Pinna rudis TaxID=1380992 RepID=UPI001EDC968A|nr:NADH dehydrogenase subunit 6 [Pinna rudis]BCX41843.1 NADH dehydrogenase subunit 6 [Pinna rudis]
MLGLYVMQSRQPLVLFFSVVLAAVALCCSLGLSGVKLKAYMIFMVYIGGLFVLFGYMVSLIPMDLGGSRYMLWGPMVGGIGMTLGVLFVLSKEMGSVVELEPTSDFSIFVCPLAVGLAVILLLVMIAVVKISDLDKGCLRHSLKGNLRSSRT